MILPFTRAANETSADWTPTAAYHVYTNNSKVSW